ncbi:MAG TPA: uroporphyrinogen-III C-methyltransferase [Terriglobia bacterium]|nr:uroporphyrinogen-III C-methyltransferase [Terriglobia bacterium]
MSPNHPLTPCVYLIGAGPGDPELLTLKGLRCLQEAECVVYDSLVNTDLLQHALPGAEWICVGKRGGSHTISQEDINALLIEKAQAGKVVVRLKGGDPFIFGRGGEEAEALASKAIPFEIVPGVTSGYAAPAYAGIPVTHRDFSPSVAFITGHEDPNKEESLIAWDKIATGVGTLVFFMGVANLPEIVRNLIQHGRSPKTPIALVQWGTFQRQEVVCGTLSTIVDQVKTSGLSAPAITVVGDVVSLRDKLRWFDNRPMSGKRILITRPSHQAEEFRRRLTAFGAEVIAFPAIEIRDPSSWEALDRAIHNIEVYQWLVFTSVNGVEKFFSRYRQLGSDLRDLKGIRIAAIGSATEKAVAERGLKVEILPDEFRAEGLLQSLKGKVLKGSRILIPRAKVARDILPVELEKQGAQVEVVDAYETTPPRAGRERLELIVDERPLDMIVFTSSSTVTNMVEMVKPSTLRETLKQTAIAAIGPITKQTAESQGLEVQVQPSQYTIPALVDAIVNFYGKR